MTFFKFKLRYILQNITHNIGSQVVILLSLSLLMVLLISSTNMYHGLRQVFYYESEEQYLETDIVITYDVNSSSRVINRRDIENEFPSNFESISVFMNYYSTGKANGDFFYFEIITSTLHEMERVAQIDISALSERDIVITKSLSEKYDLSTGDLLQIAINGVLQDYRVDQIVIDNGIFQGDKIFFLKETLMNDMYGLSNLDNIGNKIYLDVKDDQNIEDLILQFKSTEKFIEYHIFSTIDEQEISRKALYNSSIFAGVGLLMIFAIYMVFHSLFPLLFKEYKPQLGVINSLGGKDKFLKQVWNTQIFLLLVISFIIGVIGSYFVINQGAVYYGVNSNISLNILSVIIGFAGISLLVVIEVSIFYRKIKEQSVVALSTDFRYQKSKRNYIVVGVHGLILLMVLIFKPFSTGVNAVFVIASSIIFFMSLLEVIFSFSSSKLQPSIFRLYALKHLKENKTTHNSMKVLFIAFEVIVATLTISSFINSETTRLEKQVELDYAIMNIFNYDESILSDILLDNRVKSSDDAIIYQETVVSFQTDSVNNSKNFHFFVSMDFDEFDQYFHFKLDHEVDQSYLNNDMPYIVFPINMNTIYGVTVGDIVSLDISNEFGEIEFVVGGFFNTNYDHIIYSNLHQFEEFNNVATSNTILIQTDGSDLFQDLSEEYSSKMYYVLDFSMLISTLSSTIMSINDLFAFLCFVVVVCFIVVILNNTSILFQMQRSDLGKLKTLGLNTKQMKKLLFQEGTYVFLVVILISYIESLILTPAIPNLMVLFGYYKSIQVGFEVVLFGLFGVFSIYFISYLNYYYKWSKMNEIEEIKKF